MTTSREAQIGFGIAVIVFAAMALWPNSTAQTSLGSSSNTAQQGTRSPKKGCDTLLTTIEEGDLSAVPEAHLEQAYCLSAMMARVTQDDDQRQACLRAARLLEKELRQRLPTFELVELISGC